MITSGQIRAARALKNWNQAELSRRSGLTTPTIANIELGKQKPSAVTLQKIMDAFEAAGIEFTEGEGVRKKTGRAFFYSGREEFKKFYADIDQTALRLGEGEFLVSNVDERDFIRFLDDEALHNHFTTIQKSNISYRILIQEGDDYMPGKTFNADYRWTPDSQFYSVPFYVYGDKIAYIGFEDDDVSAYVVQNEFLSQLCIRQFDEMWERAAPPTVAGNKSLKAPSRLPKK